MPRQNGLPRCVSRRFFRGALLGLAFVFAALCAGPASAGTVRIRDFHGELVVLPDSSLDVTETIRVDFTGARNGIYRTIPVEYAGPGGFNYSLFLTEISATEAGGAPLRIERQRRGGNLQLQIFVPAAEDTSRNITLHYRVRDGLRFFEDHDELYWNVIGTGWDVPIESTSAHIILPGGVTGLRAANYTGFLGSRSQDARAWLGRSGESGSRRLGTAALAWLDEVQAQTQPASVGSGTDAGADAALLAFLGADFFAL